LAGRERPSWDRRETKTETSSPGSIPGYEARTRSNKEGHKGQASGEKKNSLTRGGMKG